MTLSRDFSSLSLNSSLVSFCCCLSPCQAWWETSFLSSFYPDHKWELHSTSFLSVGWFCHFSRIILIQVISYVLCDRNLNYQQPLLRWHHVTILCIFWYAGLASFDSILLITSILLFVIPSIYAYCDVGEFYYRQVHPLITPYTFVLAMTAQTSSVYLTVTVTVSELFIPHFYSYFHDMKFQSIIQLTQ